MGDAFDDLGAPEAVAAAFRNLPVVSLVLEGPEFRIVAANPAVTDLVGSDRNWLGRPYAEAFADVLGQGYLELIERVYRTGERTVLNEWRVEWDLPGGGRMERYLDVDMMPWRGDDGSVRGVLGQGLDVTDEVVARRAAEIEGLDAERRFHEMREMVMTLQDSLLPHGLPVLPGLRTAGSYLLAHEDTGAGGDWLDVVPRADGTACLVVGDVVGHGITASAVMGQLRAVLAERLASGAAIGDALAAADRYAAGIPEAHAATVLVAEIAPATGRLTYCTAGHPAPLLVEAGGEVGYLESSGAGPLATGGDFPVREAELAEGDLVLLYSDGIIERPGRVPSEGTVELLTTVARVARGEAFRHRTGVLPDDICEQALELLTRGTGYADDITLLAVQRVPPPTPYRHRGTVTAEDLRTLRGELDTWLDQLRPEPLDRSALQHAVGECLSNVVRHAYLDTQDGVGPVELDADLSMDGQVVMTVRDHGRWRQRSDPRAAGGRGLAMVNGLMDEVSVDRGEGSTTVTMRQAICRSVTFMEGSPAAPGARAPLPEVFRTTQQDNLLRVQGSVDILSADDLRATLRQLIGGRHESVVVDLSQVTLLASAGVQVLFDILARARSQGVRVTVRALPGTVAQHVLDLVRLPYESPASPHALDIS